MPPSLTLHAGPITYSILTHLLVYCSLTARLLAQAAIFLHEELGGAQAMGGALIVAANLLA